MSFKYHQGAKAGGVGAEVGQSPTLTADYHQPAVVYGFAQNTRDEVRLVNGGGQISGALAAEPGMKQTTFVATQYGDDVAGTLTARADGSPCADRGPNVVCVADDNANAAVDFDVSGTLKCGGGVSVDSVASNGADVIGTLCARDCKGVGDQDIGEGKVIVQWDTSSEG